MVDCGGEDRNGGGGGGGGGGWEGGREGGREGEWVVRGREGMC